MKKKKKNSEWILSIRDKQIRLMLAINKFIFFLTDHKKFHVSVQNLSLNVWEWDCESGWFKVGRIGRKKRLRLKRVTKTK